MSKKKILVVDDEEAIRELFKEYFGSLYTIFTASNGFEAKELIKEEKTRPNLIVTDILMPVMNGFELWNKTTKEFPDIPFIFMTGYSLKDVNIFVKNPIVCKKPFSFKEMAEKIEELLKE